MGGPVDPRVLPAPYPGLLPRPRRRADTGAHVRVRRRFAHAAGGARHLGTAQRAARGHAHGDLASVGDVGRRRTGVRARALLRDLALRGDRAGRAAPGPDAAARRGRPGLRAHRAAHHPGRRRFHAHDRHRRGPRGGGANGRRGTPRHGQASRRRGASRAPPSITPAPRGRAAGITPAAWASLPRARAQATPASTSPRATSTPPTTTHPGVGSGTTVIPPGPAGGSRHAGGGHHAGSGSGVTVIGGRPGVAFRRIGYHHHR